MRKSHRCQEPWDEHPLWEFRYDFATTNPPRGWTVERSNECVTYLAPRFGRGPIYFTHFHFTNAGGKRSTISRASLVRAFEYLVSRVDWVINTVHDIEAVIKSTADRICDNPVERRERRAAYQASDKITLGFARSVLLLAWAVGIHLDFFADAERGAKPPRSWTSYPFPINAEELSALSTQWSRSRQWMRSAGTVSNFAFLVAEYVNKYGLPFTPEMDETLQRAHTVYEQYLQRTEGASLAATPDPRAKPPPYSAVEAQEAWHCGLCGAGLE